MWHFAEHLFPLFLHAHRFVIQSDVQLQCEANDNIDCAFFVLPVRTTTAGTSTAAAAAAAMSRRSRSAIIFAITLLPLLLLLLLLLPVGADAGVVTIT